MTTLDAFGVDRPDLYGEVEKRFVSAKERGRLHEQGHAMAPLKGAGNKGRYPIKNKADLVNAKRALGRAKPSTRPAVRRHINAEAARLGAPKLGQTSKRLTVELVNKAEQPGVSRARNQLGVGTSFVDLYRFDRPGRRLTGADFEKAQPFTPKQRHTATAFGAGALGGAAVTQAPKLNRPPLRLGTRLKTGFSAARSVPKA